MRIDSHHHFWHYSAEEYPWIDDSMAVLQRDFVPADLQAETTAAKIDGVISVQARQSLAETEWLLELAGEHDFVRGVVGWLPLAAADVDQHLARLSRFPLLKSVRHVVQDEADDAFILGREFNRGVAQLSDYDLAYDILIFAKHLPHTLEFVDRHPRQRFILDHIAKPTIRSREFDAQWALQLRRLAERSQVACKFSGVVTEVRDAEWSLETLRPYWDVALEAFGPERLMFGSDWPVCLLRSGYTQWVRVVAELAAELSADEQRNFWGENARRFYHLD